MNLSSLAGMILIYAHLLLCVFALHEVLVGDVRFLRRTLRVEELMKLHRRVAWLLSGLWLTGVAAAMLDVGFDPTLLGEKPKTLIKLMTVGVLTVNGFLLRYWCFPRIDRLGELGIFEMGVVISAGAVSTSSWLLAAFLGVADQLRSAPFTQLLAFYASVLTAALVGAMLLATWWRRFAAPGKCALVEVVRESKPPD